MTSLMKEQDKEEWLVALRSGRYKNGKYALCKVKETLDGYEAGSEKFCCLGVAVEALTYEWWILDHYGDYGLATECEGWDSTLDGVKLSTTMPSVEVALRLGLSLKDMQTLACKNDGENGRAQGFKKIADWIEKNIQTYNPNTKEGKAQRAQWLEENPLE